MPLTFTMMLLLAQTPVPHPPVGGRVIHFESWQRGGVPGQMKAPCPDIPILWTFEGKCWGKTTDKVPCPPETRQFDKACYVPAVEDKKPPPVSARE